MTTTAPGGVGDGGGVGRTTAEGGLAADETARPGGALSGSQPFPHFFVLMQWTIVAAKPPGERVSPAAEKERSWHLGAW